MINKIIKFLKKYLRYLRNKARELLEIYDYTSNINYDLCCNQKRMLIVYINPFCEKRRRKHTNYFEAIQILKVFIECNFVIDLIDAGEPNQNKLIKNNYDIIFGLGKPFYDACLNNPKALKILYLTENRPDLVKINFNKRLEYYNQRHNKMITGRIRNGSFKEEYLKIADIGIIFASDTNIHNFDGWFSEYYQLFPSGFINKSFIWAKKDITSFKNFLWFGSAGVIHKGLDLLIDAVENCPSINLFICGIYKDEKKLFNFNKYKNVFVYDYVTVDDAKFIDLINKCTFVVLPSCSEGISTGVLTCMLHGLIPVVTQESGIDVYDFGYIIESYRVEEIKKMLIKLSEANELEINKKSKKVLEYSRDKYTLTNFTDNFRNIIYDINSKIIEKNIDKTKKVLDKRGIVCIMEATSNQQPATSNQQPATSNQQPATTN